MWRVHVWCGPGSGLFPLERCEALCVYMFGFLKTNKQKKHLLCGLGEMIDTHRELTLTVDHPRVITVHIRRARPWVSPGPGVRLLRVLVDVMNTYGFNAQVRAGLTLTFSSLAPCEAQRFVSTVAVAGVSPFHRIAV